MTAERTDRELLPCPFCGRDAERARSGPFGWFLKVRCSNRNCGAAFSYWQTDEWNRRSPAGVPTGVPVANFDPTAPHGMINWTCWPKERLKPGQVLYAIQGKENKP